MPDRRAALLRLAGLALLPGLARAGTPEGRRAAVLGVVPIHSLRSLVERFDPLRAWAQTELERPARVESAADFRAFHRRTLRLEFDLLVTPIHLARLAQLEAGYQPLVQFLPAHDTLLVHDAALPIRLPDDLRGRQLAVIDQLAITVMAGVQQLEAEGLRAGIDYRLVEHRTHASALHSLLTGLSAAAITTSQGLRQLAPEQRARIRVLRHVNDVPAFVILAHPAIDTERARRLRTSLLGFAAAPDSSGFFERIGYAGLRPADDAVMRQGDTYLKASRALLTP